MAEFGPAIKIVLRNEGGYVHNPNDPGGETNFGISKATYPDVDIKNLTEEKASQIYYNDYWLKNGLGGIYDQNVANFALDTLVHHGMGPKLLQLAVNDSGGYTKPDNAMGPKTIQAINSVSPRTYLSKAIDRRVAYMEELVQNNPALGEFLGGWKRRVKFFFIQPYLIPGALLLGGALGVYIWMRQR